MVPRRLEREGVEEWKTLFYELEGWEPAHGPAQAEARPEGARLGEGGQLALEAGSGRAGGDQSTRLASSRTCPARSAGDLARLRTQGRPART